MSNDFDFFQTDDDDELSDWLTRAAEFEEQEEAPMPEAAPMPELADEPPSVAAPLEDMPEEDEFDLLRERSALASEIYDDFQVEELAASSGGISTTMTGRITRSRTFLSPIWCPEPGSRPGQATARMGGR